MCLGILHIHYICVYLSAYTRENSLRSQIFNNGKTSLSLSSTRPRHLWVLPCCICAGKTSQTIIERHSCHVHPLKFCPHQSPDFRLLLRWLQAPQTSSWHMPQAISPPPSRRRGCEPRPRTWMNRVFLSFQSAIPSYRYNETELSFIDT